MSELVVMGFSDRYRAEEVLGQLRRLDFSWAAELENAVAAEVDARGQLRFRHSMVLDPAFGDSAPAWRALLAAIQAPVTRLQPGAKEGAGDSQCVSAEASLWRRSLAAAPEFLRDLGALLRPGDSAILAVLTDGEAAVRVLRGYSNVLLRTTLTEVQASKLRTAHRGEK